MSIVIKNVWDRSQIKGAGYEKNGLPSKTIPNDALSISDLIKRQERGLPLDANKRAVYAGMDIELPNLKRMDLTEIASFKKEVEEKYQLYLEEADKQEKIRQKAEEEKLKKYENLEQEFKLLKEKYEKSGQ